MNKIEQGSKHLEEFGVTYMDIFEMQVGAIVGKDEAKRLRKEIEDRDKAFHERVNKKELEDAYDKAMRE